jgi:hypothetical protein
LAWNYNYLRRDVSIERLRVGGGRATTGLATPA